VNLLSDLTPDDTAAVAQILEREGWSIVISPPCHALGCSCPHVWLVSLMNDRGIEGHGRSPNLQCAIILAEGALLRAIERHAQESKTIPRVSA
jgi:hypothetical protein